MSTEKPHDAAACLALLEAAGVREEKLRARVRELEAELADLRQAVARPLIPDVADVSPDDPGDDGLELADHVHERPKNGTTLCARCGRRPSRHPFLAIHETELSHATADALRDIANAAIRHVRRLPERKAIVRDPDGTVREVPVGEVIAQGMREQAAREAERKAARRRRPRR